MLHRTLPGGRQEGPWRPLRVLIEDPRLVDAQLDRTVCAGMDVTICSGPVGTREACPLVLDGSCPLGEADLVVCGLDGDWAAPVCAGWREAAPIVVDARDLEEDDPAARFVHHLGAAIGALHAPYAEQHPEGGPPSASGR